MTRRPLISAVLLGIALFGQPGAAQQGVGIMAIHGTEAGFQDWIAEFRIRAITQGVPEATFDTAMAQRSFRLDVLDRDRRQDEFTRTIWDYLDRAVSEDRIAHGLKALEKHAALLDQIEARYDVDRQAVVAIWGLESAYGAVRGDIPTLDALATLAYDGRRGAYFEAELITVLRMLAAGEVTEAQLVGSWAGAMGHTQFMPSSHQALAQDFDGDGRRNIWDDDPADALASTAAYLKNFGWKRGEPWGVEVSLSAGFDHDLAGSRTKKPLSFWTAQGVGLPERPLPEWGALLLPAGAQGPAFLVFDNFGAIESYNIADSYVIAVGLLSDRLKGAAPVQHPWPRQWTALTLSDRIEMQGRLTAQGFDAGGADGKVGPRTMAAIKAFQRARGLIPDGYANSDLLALLREAGSQRR
jgi:membrane-bound lytic murein transglycosylase B